jgi:hypothetical protein
MTSRGLDSHCVAVTTGSSDSALAVGSDVDPATGEEQLKFHQEWLTSLGITRPMTVAMPAERLIQWLLKENGGPVEEPRSDVERALRSLLDRGLLVEIDE